MTVLTALLTKRSSYPPFQTTIGKSVTISGIGVHSGLTVELELHPLAANMGIIFERSDLKDNAQIMAGINRVVDTRFSTTLGNSFGVTLSTVEHLMAALSAFGISNILVRVSGSEMPIMDGSAGPFMDLLQKAGIVVQEEKRQIIKIKKNVELKEERRWVCLEPADKICFDLSVDFQGREGLKPESGSYSISADVFEKDISKARSFGFYQDAQALYAAGLAKGSSLDNAVVIKEGKVMNKEGLRYQNEMVRHKILDAMGDFYLTGLLLYGKCSGHNIGHEFNNRIMKKLLGTPGAAEIVTL